MRKGRHPGKHRPLEKPRPRPVGVENKAVWIPFLFTVAKYRVEATGEGKVHCFLAHKLRVHGTTVTVT